MSEIETPVFKIPAVPAFKRVKNPGEKKSCANLDEKKKTENKGTDESREKDSAELKRKHNRRLNDATSLNLSPFRAMVESIKRRKKRNPQRSHRHLQMKTQKLLDFLVGSWPPNESKSSDLRKEVDAVRPTGWRQMMLMAKKGNIGLPPNGPENYRLVRQNAFYGTWPEQSTQ